MPIGTSKVGALGGLVPGGTVTFNASGNWDIPPGVKKVSITGKGGTGNPGNSGNPGNAGTAGDGGSGASGGGGSTAHPNPFSVTVTGSYAGGKALRAPKINTLGSTNCPTTVLLGGVGLANLSPGPGSPGRQGTPGQTGSSGSGGSAGSAGNAGQAGNASSGLGFNFAGGAGGNAGAAGNAGTGGSGGGGGTAGNGANPAPGNAGTGGAGGTGAQPGKSGANANCTATICTISPGAWGGGGGGGAGSVGNAFSWNYNAVPPNRDLTRTQLASGGIGGSGNSFVPTPPAVFPGSVGFTFGQGGSSGSAVNPFPPCANFGTTWAICPSSLRGPAPTAARFSFCSGATTSVPAENAKIATPFIVIGGSGSIQSNVLGGVPNPFYTPLPSCQRANVARGGAGGGKAERQSNCSPTTNFRAGGGGGGGGRGNVGNAGGAGGAGGTAVAANPTTQNCVTVTPGATVPITVASPGGQIVISWNPQ